MNTAALARLGFSPKETEIYLLLLQHGRLSPAEIARLTRISRPTVYSVAKTLVRKGVVVEDLGGQAKTFVAKPPEDLVILANREEQELAKKREWIAEATKELGVLALGTKYHVPKIVCIGEEDIDTYTRERSPVWDKSIMARDGVYWGFQDNVFPKQFEKWIEWYWKQAPKGLKLQLLSNASDTDTRLKSKYERRIIRPWDKAAKFTATTWVMGDYVVLLNTRTHPWSLIEIFDQAFAENFRQIFKAIWETIEK